MKKSTKKSPDILSLDQIKKKKIFLGCKTVHIGHTIGIKVCDILVL